MGDPFDRFDCIFVSGASNVKLLFFFFSVGLHNLCVMLSFLSLLIYLFIIII